MSVFVVYRPKGEHATEVEGYLREFEQRTAHTLELVDPDSRNGVEICRLYDVVEYPSIVATTDDGQLRHVWRGLPLPLINEVNTYV